MLNKFNSNGHYLRSSPATTLIFSADLLVSDDLPPTQPGKSPPVTSKPYFKKLPPTPTLQTSTTAKPTPTTKVQSISISQKSAVTPTRPSLQRTTLPSPTNDGRHTEASPTQPQQVGKSRLSWTENPADRPKATKKPGKNDITNEF